MDFSENTNDNKYLPKDISWFRLPAHVKKLLESRDNIVTLDVKGSFPPDITGDPIQEDLNSKQKFIDSLNAEGFSVEPDETKMFLAVIWINFNGEITEPSEVTLMFKRGKGEFGTEVENEVVYSDFVEIEKLRVNGTGSTLGITYNLGDIGSSTIEDYINSESTEYDLEANNIYFFLAEIDGVSHTYLFSGEQPTVIGGSNPDVSSTDFTLISISGNPTGGITHTSDIINDGADGNNPFISKVEEDLAPKLGGNLDVDGKQIISSEADGNIVINPNGEGITEVFSDLKVVDNDDNTKILGVNDEIIAGYTDSSDEYKYADGNVIVKTNGEAALPNTEIADVDAAGAKGIPTSEWVEGKINNSIVENTSELANDGSDGTSTYAEHDELATNTSELLNDGSDGTSTYAEHDELGAVATSNDFNDLDNKPPSLFLGLYISLVALQAAQPTAIAGNYANVDAGIGVPVKRYLWDVSDVEWILGEGVHNTNTSELNNDGDNGVDPFITAEDVIRYSINTGIINGGEVTINGSNADEFDVAVGEGWIIDWSNPLNPKETYLTWDEMLGNTIPNIATTIFTAIYIQESATPGIGEIVIIDEELATPEDRRLKIKLQSAIHVGVSTITSISGDSKPAYEVAEGLLDYILTLGVINVNNIYEANGANLLINKGLGTTTLPFINRENSLSNPTQKTNVLQTGINFSKTYQDGGGGFTFVGGGNTVPTDFYDDGSGTLAAIPGGKYIVHRFHFFGQTETSTMEYGQKTHNDLKKALEGINKDIFVSNNTLNPGILTTYLAIKEGTTDIEQAIIDEEAQFLIASTNQVGGIADAGNYITQDTDQLTGNTGNKTIDGDWEFTKDITALSINGVEISNNLNNTNFIGSNSGTSNTGGNANGLGYLSLQNNTANNSNGFGSLSLYLNTGDNSSGFGHQSLLSNTGDFSNGFGNQSLLSNTGDNSSGFGNNALSDNIGDYSNGFGSGALKDNEGESANGFGNNALEDNIGDNSNGFGNYSLFENIGNNSNGSGESALEFNTGVSASGFGNLSLQNNTGQFSAGLGHQTLQNNTGGNSVGVGSNTLQNNTGDSAVGIGNGALRNNTGESNTAIGKGASNTSDLVLNALTNITTIGSNAMQTKSNQVVLGDTNVVEVLTTGSVVCDDIKPQGFIVLKESFEVLVSGVVTAYTSLMHIDTENGDATDDCDTINGAVEGALLIIHPGTGTRTVVLKDNTGNLKMNGDFTLDNFSDVIRFIGTGVNTWQELSRSDNGN